MAKKVLVILLQKLFSKVLAIPSPVLKRYRRWSTGYTRYFDITNLGQWTIWIWRTRCKPYKTWNGIVRAWKKWLKAPTPPLTLATVLHPIKESYIYRTLWTLCINRLRYSFTWFRVVVFPLMLSLVAVINA